MNKKAYVLIKGEGEKQKMIGSFHNSRRAVKKLYPEQLKKDGYSIGVFTFSYIEDKSQMDKITLYTDYRGVSMHKNGEGFYAVDGNYRKDMSGFYKIEVNEEDIRKAKYNTYFIEDIDSVEIIGKGQ